MQNRGAFKPTILSSFLASIILILDGLSMVFFGFIYLVGSANADFFSDPEKKDVVLRQGEVVALLTLLYLIFCIVTLVYWLKGRRSWNYVVLGLGLFHLTSCSYLMVFSDWERDLARLCFYDSLTLNLFLVAIAIFGRRKLESLIEDSKA